MTPFTTLTGPAIGLDRANIDTDQIIPARFLRKPRSAGYQNFLFHDLRREEADFPLNGATAAILVADSNFGCGSSREGAVYALVDAGIRCVIAPSFGDIFAGNAGKNGLLTIVLPAPLAAALRAQLPAEMTIDLPGQHLHFPDGTVHSFDMDPFRKRCLIEGLDDIGLTLAHAAEIAAFQERDRTARPWAAPSP
ncbi:MAG: 3-isopropylmalate dehydratase small subunit [Rhodospirillales bacterium]|nr:3-isopropylmalate dehydratase small subunit [Rhodospirillales bacterium]